MFEHEIPKKVWILAKNMKETEWGATNFDILLLRLPDEEITPLFTSLEKAQLFATILAKFKANFSQFRVFEITDLIVKGKTWLDPSPIELVDRLANASKQEGQST